MAQLDSIRSNGVGISGNPQSQYIGSLINGDLQQAISKISESDESHSTTVSEPFLLYLFFFVRYLKTCHQPFLTSRHLAHYCFGKLRHPIWRDETSLSDIEYAKHEALRLRQMIPAGIPNDPFKSSYASVKYDASTDPDMAEYLSVRTSETQITNTNRDVCVIRKTRLITSFIKEIYYQTFVVKLNMRENKYIRSNI